MNKNFFFSYDLNGTRPSHAEMDKHVAKIGAVRVLETVWHVKAASKEAIYAHVNGILSTTDRVLVIDSAGEKYRNLLVPDLVMDARLRANGLTAPRPPAVPLPRNTLLGR